MFPGHNRMKRFLTILIAVVYLCLSIGVTLHVHYCMGKLVETSLVEQEDDHHCPHCGMDKKSSGNDCCKDGYKTFKNAGDQELIATADFQPVFSDIPPVLPIAVFHSVLPAGPHPLLAARANAPPGLSSSCPLYLRWRNIRL